MLVLGVVSTPVDATRGAIVSVAEVLEITKENTCVGCGICSKSAYSLVATNVEDFVSEQARHFFQPVEENDYFQNMVC